MARPSRFNSSRFQHRQTSRGLVLLLICLAGFVSRVVGRAADIAPVLGWTVNTERREEKALELVRGETIVLQATFKNNGAAIHLGEATSVLLRYTSANPATNETYHAVTGTVYNAASGITRVRWTPAAEDEADDYFYELAVLSASSTVVRARGSLTLLPGVGDSDAAYDAAEFETLDWATLLNTNTGSAPFILAPSGAPTGSILYKSSGVWTYLSPGTSGYALNTQGTGLPPVWAAAGAGDLTAVTSADSSITVASGTGPVPDLALPATLPARSGANLTALNASNLASGTVPAARLSSANIQTALGSVYLPLTGGTLSGDFSVVKTDPKIIIEMGGAPTAEQIPTLQFGIAVDNEETTQDLGNLDFYNDAPELVFARITGFAPTNLRGGLRFQTADVFGALQTAVTINYLQNMSVVGAVSASSFSGSGASLTSLPAGNLTGTIAAARLGEQRILIGCRQFMLERTSTCGWDSLVSGNFHMDSVKSAATTLQAFTLGSDPVEVPYGFAAFRTTIAARITWIADDADATDAKITGYRLIGYPSPDLTGSPTTLLTASGLSSTSGASTITKIDIDRSAFSSTTVPRYIVALVDASVRSNGGAGATARQIAVISVEVFSE